MRFEGATVPDRACHDAVFHAAIPVSSGAFFAETGAVPVGAGAVPVEDETIFFEDETVFFEHGAVFSCTER